MRNLPGSTSPALRAGVFSRSRKVLGSLGEEDVRFGEIFHETPEYTLARTELTPMTTWMTDSMK